MEYASFIVAVFDYLYVFILLIILFAIINYLIDLQMLDKLACVIVGSIIYLVLRFGFQRSHVYEYNNIYETNNCNSVLQLIFTGMGLST